jgi:hypothetical protein
MVRVVVYLVVLAACGGANAPTSAQAPPSPVLSDQGALDVKPVRIQSLGPLPITPRARHVLRIPMGTDNYVTPNVAATAVVGSRRFPARIVRFERTTSDVVVDLPNDVDPRNLVVRLMPPYIHARVLRVEWDGHDSTITVDKGRSHGIDLQEHRFSRRHVRFETNGDPNSVEATIVHVGERETELKMPVRLPPDLTYVHL